MPSRTPTLEDIQLPNIGGPRPVAGIDVSGYGRGAQALAQSGIAVGKDIQSVAQDVNEYTTHMQTQAVQNGLMDLSTSYINNRNQFAFSNDPQAVTDWQNANQDARNRAVDAIGKVAPPGSPLFQHFSGRAGLMQAEEDSHITNRTHELESSQSHADRLQDIEGLRITTPNPDGHFDPTEEERLRGVGDRISTDFKAGRLTSLQAQQLWQHATSTFTSAQLGALANAAMGARDPDQREKLLKAMADAMGRQMRPRLTMPWGAASIVSQGETSDPSIGPRALGNISRDSNNSKSYGFMGLNSVTGSAGIFARRYGVPLGITAVPGSQDFDRQWKAAATNQPGGFRKAQLDYFNKTYLSQVSTTLQREGIPENIANDPRVQTYFADRSVQMGNLRINNVAPAWRGANGDVISFLHNMNAIDHSQYQSNFRRAIATGVYSLSGDVGRLNTRLNGALSTPTDGSSGTAFSTPADPHLSVEDTNAPRWEPVAQSQHPMAPLVQQSLTEAQQDHWTYMIERIRNQGERDDLHRQVAEEKARNDAADALEMDIITKHALDPDNPPYTEQQLVSMGPGFTNQIPLRRLWPLVEFQNKLFGSRENKDAKELGPGYQQAFTDIVSGNMTDKSEIAQRFLSQPGQLFPAGVRRLQEDWDNQHKKTEHEFELNKKIDSALAYAKDKMVVEEDFGFGPKIRNPEGYSRFTGTFVPRFLDAMKAARDASKTGLVPDEFFDTKNYDKLINQIYPENKKNADLVANRQAQGEQPDLPNAPLPPAPEGVTPEGWKTVMGRTPQLDNGQPMSHARWASILGKLMAHPSPEVMAALDSHIAETGWTAKDLLATLNPAAARSLEITGGIGGTEETTAPTAPTVVAPQVTPLPPNASYEERRQHAVDLANQRAASIQAAREEARRVGPAAANEAAMRAGGAVMETPEETSARLERYRISRIESLKEQEKTLRAAKDRSPMGQFAESEIARVVTERQALEKQVIPDRVEPTPTRTDGPAGPDMPIPTPPPAFGAGAQPMPGMMPSGTPMTGYLPGSPITGMRPNPRLTIPTAPSPEAPPPVPAPAAASPAPAGPPPYPPGIKPRNADDQLKDLDRREYALKRSGLKGALFDAQMKRINDERKRLQAEKEAKQ